MKNVKSVLIASVLLLVAGGMASNKVYAQNSSDKKKSNKVIEPNGNYKHSIPSSQGHTFNDNFTKVEKDSINRNYKQQNPPKRKVRFRDHFKSDEKREHRTYKDPEGL